MRGLAKLGYGTLKTHADGRFEVAGGGRSVIEAEMDASGQGAPAENQCLA